MRRPLAIALIVAALAAAGCGAGGGQSRARRIVTSALERVNDESFRFEYVERLVSPQKEVRVRGLVQDDLRSRAKMSLDGKDLIEMVVSDDALAVRVFDPAKAGRYIAAVANQDKAVGEALKAGRWVIDHQGAPEIVAPRTNDNTVEVGVNPMLDASTYIFQYVTDALNASAGVGEFNPDSVDYNPLDDPWKEDAEVELVDEGVRRYDIGQPPLPRPTQRGTGQALPGTPHFRKMAFYMRGRDLVEMKEQILIADRPEFRRAAAGRAAKYYNELKAESLAGATRDPIRQRAMELTFERMDDVSIALPASNFVSAPAIDLITAVGTLVPPPPRGRAGPGTPPAPGASPGASPGSTSSPLATVPAGVAPGGEPDAP